MNPKFYNRFKGFSVAEAMVTLLIVSIALSAIAPIFSKRNAATRNTQSKWEPTRSGNITRTIGNMGLGLSIEAAETIPAKLRIVDKDTNTYDFGHYPENNQNANVDAYFSIKGAGNTTIFEISKANGITFRLPQNNNEIMKLQNNNGDTVATINSDGSTSFISKAIQFLKSDSTADANAKVVIKDDGSAVFSAGNSTINADGSASFGVPAGAIMFFSGTSCPTNYTSTSVPCACTCSAQGGCTCECSLGEGFVACQRNAYTTPAGG